MGGRDDEEQGQDVVDDWFDEPQSSGATRRTQVAPVESEDDWLGASTTRRTPRRPSADFLGSLSGRWWAIAAVVVSLIVLLIAILAIAGVFSSSESPGEPLTLPGSTTTQSTTTQKTTTTTATSVPAPTVPLKPGDSGDQVKVLQKALASLGYDVGTIDGVYGTSTTNAVIAFQKAAGLTADGVVGPATRTALKTALENK